MSTPNKQLIAAIQRIAEGSPLFTEVRGLLKEIQRRGGIEGLSLKIGADDDAGGDCCTDANETGEPTESESADLSGDAPPDMSGGTPDGWTDCETGQAIRFTPAGFAQPETCKECGPDETWQSGYYWVVAGYISTTASATPDGARALRPSADDYRIQGPRAYDSEGAPTEYQLERYACGGIPTVCEWTTVAAGYVYRVLCTGSDGSYCRSDAPETCGDNWDSDSTTNYTLVNGCIVASTCDTDASEQAKQCNQQIKICDENGNERIIQSIGNGQFIMYDETGTYKGGRYNAATGERLEVLDPGSNGGYGSVE